MSRERENFYKKEQEERRLKKKKEKEQKKEERKASKSSKSFEDMIAYVDEFGNITSTPPDPTKKKATVKEEDIEISVPRQSQRREESPVRRGKVTFFNSSKGFGFIKDEESQDSIFVHINQVDGLIKENDKVTFEVERGPKGLNAIKVKINR